MDQIKIGKFIAQLRKEQNMTQLELATKLGITDRAISKWENGRGLPDLSLIGPLCDILCISINELLSGERIEKEQITEKSEENIINTLKYFSKNIKKTKKVFFIIITTIILLIASISTCFCVDINRMRNDLPVVFSTWGIKYAPPINLDSEKIEFAIKEHLVTSGNNQIKHQNARTFVALKTYLVEEVEKETRYSVYTWVLNKQLYLENNAIKEDGGFSAPYSFTIQKINNTFIVTDSHTPRDGSYYLGDMKKIFPKSVRKDMDNVYIDGTYERLALNIDEQIQLYFHREY